MQTSREFIEVLYVAAGDTSEAQLGQDGESEEKLQRVSEASERLGRGSRVQISSVAVDNREAWPETADVDCVLLGTQAGDEQFVDGVEAVRARYPSVPLVVFTGDHGHALIEQVLDAGATDVIQSTPTRVAPALVRRRIENVLDTPAADQIVERYETILNTAADAIYQLDADGRFLALNDTAVELFGFSRSEVVGSHISEFLDDEFVQAGRERIREHLDGDTTTRQPIEVEIETASGERIPCEARVAVWTTNGDLAGSVGVIRDVSDRREREQELARQNDLFTKAQAIADVGAWEYNADEANIWTDQVRQIYGAPEELELTLDNVERFYHPDDWPAVKAAFARALDTGEQFDVEARLATDAGQKWVHLRGDPQVEDGRFTRVRGTIQDITERKEREEELERNREFLRQVQQVADIGGWEVDLTAGTLNWTNEVYHIHDLPTEYEPTVEEGISFYHPEDRPTIRAAFDRLLTEGEPYDIEVRLVTAEDDVRWVRTWGEPLVEDSEVVGARGVIRDIHERKQRERDLQTERDLIERILETSPVGIVVHDADGQVVRANEQAATLLGLDHAALSESDHSPEEVRVLTPEGVELDEKKLPVGRILETEEAIHGEELVVETPDGESIIAVDGVPLFEEGDLQRVVVTFDDVTERVERERRLETQRDELEQLDHTNRIIRTVDTALLGARTREEIEQAVCDRLSSSERYAYAAALRQTGDGRLEPSVTSAGPRAQPAEGVLSRPASDPSPAQRALETGEAQAVHDIDPPASLPPDAREGAADTAVRSLATIPLTYEGQTYGVVAVHAADAEAFSGRELDVLGELGRNVGHAIAAAESREREATVTSLYEATQDLLAADTTQEVCDVVVDTAASVLDPPGLGIFLFDDEENVLEPAAATDELLSFYGETTTFGPERDSVTWQAYVTGEETFLPDIRESEHAVNPETEARSVLFLPLGDHGVFVVATTDQRRFDNQRRRLMGLLAATTEAALDRVAGRADIRERDRQLAERAARIEQFEQMFSFVEAVDRQLRRASTREEIERGVCEQAVGVDSHAFAWIGAVPPDESSVEPRAWAGSGEAYLDDVSLALDGTEPAARAATGDSVVVEDVTDHLRSESWTSAAISQGYQSVMAVPLVDGETTYGVLAVYADTPDAFGEIVQPVLETLGETIAHSINSTETERAVLAEQAVELELRLPDPGTFLNAVAAVAGGTVRYHEVVPESNDRARVLFELSDPPVADVLALESEFVSVESLTHVERGDEQLFRATLAGQTVAATLLDCGAIPETVEATATETTATVRLPRELDVRVFLDRVQESYPETELVSRRDVEETGGAVSDVRATLEEGLTDRQREVLLTAYESGFFESPRRTTGAELADLLGVSQPTVTHHLREAQRRLFDALFEAS